MLYLIKLDVERYVYNFFFLIDILLARKNVLPMRPHARLTNCVKLVPDK